MPHASADTIFRSGTFAGVSRSDAFAAAAMQESPVIINLGPVAWPANRAPKVATLGGLSPGKKITGPAPSGVIDVLIILYTDPETSALLDVFTGKSGWTATTQKTWYPYAHNFDQFKNSIQGLSDNDSLRAGIFGHLFSLTVGTTRVALYKTELHPKTNGPSLPFIPVIAQLVGELEPKLVISTGTAGGIGSKVNCGDVVITNSARLHCKETYPSFPKLNTLSKNNTQLTNTIPVDDTYIKQAAASFTALSMPGLQQCYSKIAGRPGYSFLKKNTQAPAIYLAGVNPVPGPEPMDIVSADYLTVDDNNDSEGLQALGIMNDTDDAFAFYAISTLPTGKQPKWLSVRNASEPQVNVPAFPAGTSPTQIVNKLKGLAGAIYGVYQYCTTLNSAFACWGIAAGM
ncbi:MAG: hypothetical protein ABSH13_11755 [Candidatus Acidiferrum sp.]|jgi:hypothetical protein